MSVDAHPLPGATVAPTLLVSGGVERGETANPAMVTRIGGDGRVALVIDAVGVRARAFGAATRTASVVLRTLQASRAPSLPVAVERALDVANVTCAALCESEEAPLARAVSVAGLAIRGDRLCVFNIGNTRIYRLSAGNLEQCVPDHCVLSQLGPFDRAAPPRAFERHYANLVTDALGLEERAKPAIRSIPATVGDRFVLCTANVWTEVVARTLGDLLARGSQRDVATIVRRAIRPSLQYAFVVADLLAEHATE